MPRYLFGPSGERHRHESEQFTLDTDTWALRGKEARKSKKGARKPPTLTSQALSILKLLLERPGVTVAHHEILTEIWSDTHAEQGSIYTAISQIRKRLG